MKFRSITEAIDTETPTGPHYVADDRHDGRVRAQPYQRTDPRRSEGRKETGGKFGRKKKLAPAQITKARKLIEAGERVEDVAALWNVGRTTLYRALAS